MKTTYFGIHFNNSKRALAQEITARLFLSPDILVENVERCLKMLENGVLSIEDFQRKTNASITSFFVKSNEGVEIQQVMRNRLEAWKSAFGNPNKRDYAYLESQFGLDKQALFGEETDESLPFKNAKEMAAWVKQYIIGQDEAIDQLSVAFFQHLDCKLKQFPCRIVTPFLLMGGTGTGKSETLRLFGLLAARCNCPVIRISSQDIVPHAWKGTHLSDIIAQKLAELIENERYPGAALKNMEYAIIIIPEFDKITHFSQRLVGQNSSDMDSDMMREIMRLRERGYRLHLEYGINSRDMTPRTFELPVENLLLVFDGAFQGIEDIIKRRMNIQSTIGFTSTENKKYDGTNIMKYVQKEDLQAWGYLPELIGRIGDIIVMNQLTAETIYTIMTKAKDSIIASHIDYCKQKNIELRFDEDALRFIAEEAFKSGLGCRNVDTLLSSALKGFYYELPENTSKNKKVYIISKQYIVTHLSHRNA